MMSSPPPSPTRDSGFIQLQAPAVYKYDPLPGINYIRRVKIHPGTFEEAIVISLEVVPFSEDQRPEYEALSYVWGSPEQPEFVRVDDRNGLTISATRNLATALKYLRHTDEPRVLWIDALCINQTDDVEKGPQVGMMGDIYRHATRVVVWLGPEADNSDLIMSKMERLGSHLHVDFAGYATISLAEGATELDVDLKNNDVYLSMEEIDALLHLFLRPWFSRLWIRQEIQLASPAAVITCGHSQVPWPVFLRAFVLLLSRRARAVERKLPNVEPAVLDRAKLLEFQLSEARTPLLGFLTADDGTCSLRNLRQCFGFADCYDPRDRIYGVLSFLADNITKGVVPDYTKSFQDVYKDMFLRYMHRTGCLSVLESCELGTGSHIPSWVPDWSRKPRCKTFLNRGQHVSSQIAAYYGFDSHDVLRVAGILVGTIQHHEGCRSQPGWRYQEGYEELCRLLTIMIHPEKAIIDDEKLEHVTRSLLCNHFSDVWEPPEKGFPTIESGKNIVQKILSDGAEHRPLNKDEIAFLDHSHFLNGRQIFKTADGQFGVAPSEAQSGDQICILLGCDSPMILRATQDGKYQVVGPCVMPSIRNGEPLLGPLPSHVRMVLSKKTGRNIWKNTHTGSLYCVDPRFRSLNIDLRDFSKNRGTKKMILTPKFLRKGGVDIRYFDLV